MESDNDDCDMSLLDLDICVESTWTRKVKFYKKRIDPFEFYNDEEFKSFYRFDKETARNIVQLLREDLQHNSSQGAPISPEIMVMATIKYIAKGAYQNDIAEVHGISQQSMTEIIRKVSSALARRMKNIIDFPTSLEELQQLKTGFYRNPGGDFGGRHWCRKGFCSLNVQVICDSNCRILDIVAHWRGSAHDSRIWRESSIKSKLEDQKIRSSEINL